MGLGISVNYIDRVNISHALAAMSADLSIGPVMQGLILAAFSWGYVGFMLPGGILVDRYGPRTVAAVSALTWSAATLWTGLVAKPASLLASRFVLGMAEAPIFPANARMVREFLPPGRRGLATGLFDAGSYVGTALAAPLVVGIILISGWRVAFVACAVLGVAWTIAWARYAPRPKRMPRPAGVVSEPISITWLLALVADRRFVGTVLAFFAYNYGKSFFLTWMPIYLLRERGISFAALGLVGALPPAAAAFGTVGGGLLTDSLLKGGMKLTHARKVPLVLGLGVAATIGFVPLVRDDRLAIGMLTVSFAFNSGVAAILWCAPADFSHTPQTVGTIGGLQNAFANLAGMTAPLVTGIMIDRTGTFDMALVVYGSVAAVGACAYALLVDVVAPLDATRMSRVSPTPTLSTER